MKQHIAAELASSGIVRLGFNRGTEARLIVLGIFGFGLAELFIGFAGSMLCPVFPPSISQAPLSRYPRKRGCPNIRANSCRAGGGVRLKAAGHYERASNLLESSELFRQQVFQSYSQAVMVEGSSLASSGLPFFCSAARYLAGS